MMKELWALLSTPQSEINLEILYTTTNLIVAAAAAYFYKIAQQQAEQLYRAQYPAPQYPVPHSDEEKERWVRKKEWHLKIFYGICFWGSIGLAGMYVYFYIRKRAL